MCEQLTAQRIESVPSDADVRHFDELSDRAKNHLARMLHEDVEVKTNPHAIEELCQYDVIKYTDYVEVTARESGTGVCASA